MAIESLKSKIARKFTRRKSEVSSTSSIREAAAVASGQHAAAGGRVPAAARSAKSIRSRGSIRPSTPTITADAKNEDVVQPHSTQTTESLMPDQKHPARRFPTINKLSDDNNTNNGHLTTIQAKHESTSTTEFATPLSLDGYPPTIQDAASDDSNDVATTTTPLNPSSPISANAPRRPEIPRRQSLLPYQQTKLIKTLLETEIPPPSRAENLDYFSGNGPSTISANMVSRKIWVRRPGASATLVTIHEGDLVDDVRDMILKKYANSLGRSFDAPDVTLRIVPREMRQERTLGPEEPISRTLDAYFPGGQTVDEALIIDVPLRRTPKASPHILYVHPEDGRPVEGGSDYFPQMPAPTIPSPHLPPVHNQASHAVAAHAISVLTTGHIPNLPSPGGRRPHSGRERPRIGRQHTSSPTIMGGHPQTPNTSMTAINGTQFHSSHARNGRSRTHSSASEKSQVPVPPPIPTPPAQEIQRASTPPPRVSSPRASHKRRSIKKKDHPSLPAGLLNGAVPPINVLIVEDNIINLKLLEAFMKRLKVRWQTAMNGREAVTKWRSGGFHLVLMDIQLPVMSGLDATREIRRLERLNSIGVFSSSASSSAPERDANDEPEGPDKLPSTVLFKSPVIIVALTASSLQSDRHEALAAGCNDFLTKPVNFVWLERKVMEWGCMQALIDFDGWRKWKDFSAQNGVDDIAKKNIMAASAEKKKKEERKKNRNSLGSSGSSGGGSVGMSNIGVSGVGAVGANVAARIAEEAEEKAEDGGGDEG